MLAELCLAATIYAEACGEPQVGKVAVAHVVVNRTYARNKSVCQVTKEPNQFVSKVPSNKNKTCWKESEQIAKEVLSNKTEDPTNGAHYFHSGKKPKSWKGLTNVASIGGHKFYRKTPINDDQVVVKN